jgi:hypothetical protein
MFGLMMILFISVLLFGHAVVKEAFENLYHSTEGVKEDHNVPSEKRKTPCRLEVVRSFATIPLPYEYSLA